MVLGWRQTQGQVRMDERGRFGRKHPTTMMNMTLFCGTPSTYPFERQGIIQPKSIKRHVLGLSDEDPNNEAFYF